MSSNPTTGSGETPGIQSTFGPLFIGLALSIGLQGILLAQTFLYWRTYFLRDSTIFRLLVLGLCVLELFHCAMAAHAGYWYLIQNYNQPSELENLVWSLIVELALTVLITFIGRAFWITWLFKLSRKNWWLTCVTSAFSFAQLALGIGEVYEGVRKPLFSTITDGKGAVIAQMLSADVGDIIISISLCYYLHTSRSGIRKTDLLIDRLVMFIVTRGILTSGVGAVQLITFVIWPTTFIFGIFHLMASKLYTNALFATLNSRDHITDRTHNSSRHGDTGTSFVLSPLSNNTPTHGAFGSKRPIQPNRTIDISSVVRDHQGRAQSLGTSSISSSIPALSSKGQNEEVLLRVQEDEDGERNAE